MKKGFIFGIVLIISLCGCGSNDTVSETSSETTTSVSVSSDSSVTVSETEPEVDPEPVQEESGALYVDGVPFIYYLEDPTNPINVEWMDADIVAMVGKTAIIRGYDYDTGNYLISAYDTVGDGSFDVCSTDLFTYADIYNGIIYVEAYDYDEELYTEKAYDLASFVELPNNQELLNKLKGYSLYPYRVDSVSLASAGRMLGECGFIAVSDDSALYLFDGENFTNIVEMAEFTGVLGNDKNWVLLENYDEAYDFFDISVYDIKGDGINEIACNVYKFLAFEDGVVYYTRKDDTQYGLDVFEVYAYDLAAGKEKFLSTFSKHPGIRTYEPGVTGFIVKDNYIYTLYDDGKTVGWYVLPKDGPENAEPAPTAMVIDSMYYSDFGHVEAISHTISCPDCESPIFKFYEEYFVVDEKVTVDDSIKKLNDMFLEKAAASYEAEKENARAFLDGMSCEEHGSAETITVYYTISDFTYVGPCLRELTMDGYWYGGGAHGMPLSDYILFDYVKGEIVEFKDLYKGTEEDLKKIVAERAAEEFSSYGDGYSPFYGETAEEVYQDAYDYISLDNICGYYTEYSFTVEFAPYILGPYASGYIYVYLSNEELGIEVY